MHAIQTWFLQPYPFERNWKSILRSAVFAGLFVAFFLYFIKPFGTQISPGSEMKFLIICGYFGLVTCVTTLIFNGLCFVFPNVFEEEKWRVWKEILFNLVFIACIGFANLLLAKVLWKVPLTARMFWIWQGFTFAIGVFPAFFGAFWGQMKMSQKYVAEAAKLQMPHMHTTAHPLNNPILDQPIVFMGDNQNERLSLQADQLAYLASQDNYVQVFFFDQGLLKNRLLRATLRKMEEAIAGRPEFFRCHRTYIVNFDKIEKVSGNAQGYRLHLSGVEDSIPVSRNLNEVVRDRLLAG